MMKLKSGRRTHNGTKIASKHQNSPTTNCSKVNTDSNCLRTEKSSRLYRKTSQGVKEKHEVFASSSQFPKMITSTPKKIIKSNKPSRKSYGDKPIEHCQFPQNPNNGIKSWKRRNSLPPKLGNCNCNTFEASPKDQFCLSDLHISAIAGKKRKGISMTSLVHGGSYCPRKSSQVKIETVTSSMNKVGPNSTFQPHSNPGDNANNSRAQCSTRRTSNSPCVRAGRQGKVQEFEPAHKESTTKKRSSTTSNHSRAQGKVSIQRQNSANHFKKSREITGHQSNKIQGTGTGKNAEATNQSNISPVSSKMFTKTQKKIVKVSKKGTRIKPVQSACRRSDRIRRPPLRLFQGGFVGIYNKRQFKAFEKMRKLNRSLMVGTLENLNLLMGYKNILSLNNRKQSKLGRSRRSSKTSN